MSYVTAQLEDRIDHLEREDRRLHEMLSMLTTTVELLRTQVADLEKFKADKNTWAREEPGRVLCS